MDDSKKRLFLVSSSYRLEKSKVFLDSRYLGEEKLADVQCEMLQPQFPIMLK